MCRRVVRQGAAPGEGLRRLNDASADWHDAHPPDRGRVQPGPAPDAPLRAGGAPPHAARPDLRRTIRSSLRTGGDPFERHWREPAERPRPLVLVCDVSGSMEPYARMLLQYMQACVAARRRGEAFVFGTRLTRVTAELAGRDRIAPSTARRLRPADWSGGTRSARRSRRSTASTGAASAGARSWCCSPMDGTAATTSSSRPRWRGYSGVHTSSCGSPAQGPPRNTSRYPWYAGCSAACRSFPRRKLTCQSWQSWQS